MNLYAGTSGYSYKEWKGTFYPEDLPDKQMLHFYGEHFRAVEINNRMLGLHKHLFVEANPIPVKWALERMGRTLRHRGPDGCGNLALPHASLGVNRLRIVDLGPRADSILGLIASDADPRGRRITTDGVVGDLLAFFAALSAKAPLRDCHRAAKNS